MAVFSRLVLCAWLATCAVATAPEPAIGEATCAAGEVCTRGDVLLQTGQARGLAKVQAQDGPDDGGVTNTSQGVIIPANGRETTIPPPPPTTEGVKPREPPAKGANLVEAEKHEHHIQGVLLERAYKRGPSLGPPPPPEEIDALVQTMGEKRRGSPSQEEIDVFNILVRLRAQGFTCPNGQYFPPNSNLFVFDCRLWQAAEYHVQDMIKRNFFDHNSPDGKGPCERALMFGNLQGCSENIAAGQNSATAVMEAWKASKSHCPNMMDPALNRFGSGYAYGPNAQYKYYWGQSMGTDTGHVDVSCNPPGAGTYPNPAPSPEDNCKDYNAACSNYKGYAGSSYCAGSWPSSQCKRTCGFCGSAPAPTPPTPAPPSWNPSPSPVPAPGGGGSCVDKDPVNCRPYNGYAGSPYCNVAWTVANCQKTCGFCGSSGSPGPSPTPSTTPAPQVCVDAAGSQCSPWNGRASSSYCRNAWLQQNCAKTCGYCRG